jgi:hypothetical protein
MRAQDNLRKTIDGVLPGVPSEFIGARLLRGFEAAVAVCFPTLANRTFKGQSRREASGGGAPCDSKPGQTPNCCV